MAESEEPSNPDSIQSDPIWHETNLFWGIFGLCITCIFAAVGFAVSAHPLLSHWLFASAWPSGCLAIRCVYNPSRDGKNKIWFLVSIISLAILLFLADQISNRTIRAHIHVIAVDMISANPGDVIRSRVHLQNDGDLPIRRYMHCNMLAIANYFKDQTEETTNENRLFDHLIENSSWCQPGINHVPAHSIELNSDTIGKTPVTPLMENIVASGHAAIFMLGYMDYVDENGVTKRTEYCTYTKGDVRGVKLCFVHNEEP